MIHHARGARSERYMSLLRDRGILHGRVNQSMPPVQSVQLLTSTYHVMSFEGPPRVDVQMVLL